MERIKQIAQRIRSTPKAQVVVLILKFNAVQALLWEMIRTNTSRTWIASDSWSNNQFLAEMEGIEKVGNIFGMSFVSQVSESFDSWLKKLRAPPWPWQLQPLHPGIQGPEIQLHSRVLLGPPSVALLRNRPETEIAQRLRLQGSP